MIQLLQFEFRRLFRQRSLYVCGGITLAWLLLSMIVTNSTASLEPEFAPSPASLALSALSAAPVSLILGVFLALYVCDDLVNNTLKNIYAKGYTRLQVYFAKYIVSAVVTAALTILCMLLSYLFGMEFCIGTWAPEKNFFANIFAQMLLLLVYQGLYLAVDFFSGKLSVSLVFNLIGPSLIVEILTGIPILLGAENFSFSRYWVDETMMELAGGATDGDLLSKAFTMGIVYILLFAVGGCLLTRKKEV